jgi:hypothetical protein
VVPQTNPSLAGIPNGDRVCQVAYHNLLLACIDKHW